ncbi:hypothetical protein [Mediterraneibacter gnavus]|uniref:hypothetical protein n=1 Tax=Mediterraneibacter gnavus TaxID=33038 RepID=UPI00232E2DAF|nr:hypothetical protein [Mediterraneibacter gnavus]MDB8711644.1 hypothetical protein [Mediterraneibacter gnavus]MDB8714654.1 hypothetical protein [Mediterraneibacter gnavus]
MLSNVKIDNGLFLDGKKLNCVKSYRLEQAEGDDIADLTVNMDVRVFCKDAKPSNITVGSIEADQLTGLRYTDLFRVIENGALLKVIYTEDGVLKKTDFVKGSIESRNIKWRGKIVKKVKADQGALAVELED